MTNINIPPEAVEAAARAMCHNAYKHLPEMRNVDTYTPDADYWIAQATAAIRAALAAWPGVKLENLCGWVMDGPDLPYVEETASIILPLPQEPRE